jgi:hypothetical protein
MAPRDREVRLSRVGSPAIRRRIGTLSGIFSHAAWTFVRAPLAVPSKLGPAEDRRCNGKRRRQDDLGGAEKADCEHGRNREAGTIPISIARVLFSRPRQRFVIAWRTQSIYGLTLRPSTVS